MTDQRHLFADSRHHGTIECTPDECELLHELIVLCWLGREAERRGHGTRRDEPCALRKAVVARVSIDVQLEMFG
jgi:hypothetical protein